jgi:hypothetical protein
MLVSTALRVSRLEVAVLLSVFFFLLESSGPGVTFLNLLILPMSYLLSSRPSSSCRRGTCRLSAPVCPM